MIPPFIVAEIGVNYRDMKGAKRLMNASAQCGADAVKVQVYNDSVIAGHPRFDELKAIQLTPKRIKQLSKFAYALGVEFIATPMFPEAVDWLAPHVKRYKIRYEDRHNIDLFERIAASNTNNDMGVIISCDDLFFRDKNKNTSAILTTLRRGNVSYLYMLCTRASSPEQVNLPPAFYPEKYVGYSSHCRSMAAPLAAMVKGAKIIEIHVKLNRYQNGFVPIDDRVSLNMTEFERFMALKRDIARII